MATELETSRRAQVLRDALAVFARLGFEKTTMSDVAEAAGITRGGLYFLFDDKHDLLVSATEYELDSALDRVNGILADDTVALDARLVGALERWLGQHNGEATRDVGMLGRTNAAALEATFVDYRERFLEATTRAIASTPNPPADPRSAAVTLHAAAMGWKYLATSAEGFRTGVSTAARVLLPAPVERAK